ncbi:polysaccharide deacetylase [Gamsiella multidivaricata]|uniref:polysaccharide deacetylase n=1 Tax=Gamsiella multidivaricata TaxID=101098 RepID=UPI00221E4889|nr:polysaccharide deacetylase [Gamsiella multidivaricata]KAG0369618.1 hypothetical protein BGZ54_009427 [Gamsiella multidivaricata]KAI7820691.1 polysaccharide deacetylase [Gamsiella multidivaricata]
MAPITRLAVLAMLASAAFVNAVPVLAPVEPSGAVPALAASDAFASAPETSSPVLEKRAVATVITKCTKPGTIAITFDDGPSDFTNGLLDILKKKGVKTTFFLNGVNYGNITDRADVVKRAYKEGHQIASHTWSHQDLATLTTSQIKTEMKKLDDAVKKIIGVRPVFMRPPYGSVNDQVLSVLGSQGYKVVTWDKDTEDWKHPTDVAKSLKVYTKIFGTAGEVKKAGHIVLEHDTHELTALSLAPQAIDLAISKGFKVVPVGTCLGVSSSAWYRK